MTDEPLEFLLGIPDADAMRWLRAFLIAEPIEPGVTVPRDVEPVEYLLERVHPLRNSELPGRIGTLAGKLLSEAMIHGKHQTQDAGEREALGILFTLVEALPVSDEVAEFLQNVAVTGRLLDSAGRDWHLLALRALVLHQRPRPGEIDRQIDFWRREARDVRYAAIAIQGLLRISVPAAIEMVADFVRRARAADPPLPLVNTLFVVSSELGPARELWKTMRRRLEERPGDLEAVREVFRQTRLQQANPVAWDVLRAETTDEAHDTRMSGDGWTMRFELPNSPAVARARARLPDVLLAPTGT